MKPTRLAVNTDRPLTFEVLKRFYRSYLWVLSEASQGLNIQAGVDKDRGEDSDFDNKQSNSNSRTKGKRKIAVV